MAKEDLTLAVLAVIVLREVWAILKSLMDRDRNKSDHELDEIKKDIKTNSAATMENTFHLKMLTAEIKAFSRLPNDVTEAHTKIRLLDQEMAQIRGKIESM